MNRYMLLFCLLIIGLTSVLGHASDKQSIPTGSANGVLYGQFMINDSTPLAHGRLFLYNEAAGPSVPNAIARVPDNITLLDNNGRFNFRPAPIDFQRARCLTPDQWGRHLKGNLSISKWILQEQRLPLL